VTVTRTAPRLSRRASSPQARPRVRGAAAVIAAAGLLLAQLVAAAPVTGAPPTPLAAGTAALTAAPETELLPGVQYEEAMAHANDRIEFTPGGRVTVGFRPRAGDTWTVGGRSPRALPPGTLSGRELLPAAAAVAPSAGHDAPAPGTDATPAPESTAPAEDAPIDAPAADPAAPVADDASAMISPQAEPLALDGTSLRRQVFGFLPYWEVNSAVLDYELLSTIAYFSVGADANGNLLKTNSDGSTTTGWGGWTSSRLTSIINAAHLKGTRVVLTISVFAWSTGQAALQGALLGNPTARLNLARQAAAAVRARGADGINLDFEPIASGYAEEFTELVRTFRTELNNQAPGYQLTFDTTGYIGNYPLETATAAGAADAIFIMGYDYRGASTGYVGSIDPLAGPAYDLQDTLNAYAARVAPSKLILGLPWYGRAWSTVSDQVNALNQSGTQYGSSNTVVYDTAADYAVQHGRRWDSRELTPWVAYLRENCTTTYGCVTSWRQIYYDDPTSLKLRYDMVNRMGLRGAGIWALGYDGARTDMRQAIAQKFLIDTTAPLAEIVALNAIQTAETFTVQWAGTDESGVIDYDVQVSADGGPWRDWLFDTTGTSAVYVGADGHRFAFQVRARDPAGNVGAWQAGANTTLVDLPAGVVPPAGARFVGITPTRVLDSRFGVGVGGSFSSGAAQTFGVAGKAGIPTGAIAVTGTFTVVGPTSAGYASLGPSTANLMQQSVVNSPAGDVRATGVTVKLGTSGTLSALWIGAGGSRANFLFDASGYFVAGTTGATYVPIVPTRFLDTRSGNGLTGAFVADTPRSFPIWGRGGIPGNAVAVTGNLTVVSPTSSGYVFMGPAVTATSPSNLNSPRGDIRAASLTVKLDGSGRLTVVWKGAAGSSAHVLFDVTGYFVNDGSGRTFFPIEPARLLDSRSGNGLSGPFVRGVARGLWATGRGTIPVDAAAITGSLTVISPTLSGYVVVGPNGSPLGSTSTVNLPAGDIRANGVAVRTGPGGGIDAMFQASSNATTNVVFDAMGYFR
jgi:spore germination protein YaaH